MRYLPLICFLLISACKSTTPSQNIANGVINDLNAHQQAIQTLDKQTTKECKTDAFVASLNALKAQTESIAGQVKSISQACQSEKAVLEKEKTIKDIVIMVLLGILALILYFVIRKK